MIQATHQKNQFSTQPMIDGVYEKITFIGAGKMAQALIHPLIETNIQPAENITIYDVSNSTMQGISQEYNGKIQMSPSIPKAVEGADLIVMAVKPQNVDKVYEEMKQANMRDDCTLLSVIAGKPIKVSHSFLSMMEGFHFCCNML
jgi:pyrroline-5-carboxylate reductase